MGSGHGMATKASKQGKIKVELVHKPVNIDATVGAKHFRNLRALGAALHGVSREDCNSVCDALLFLGACFRAIDAAGGLCRIASAEGGLIQENDLSHLQPRERTKSC